MRSSDILEDPDRVHRRQTVGQVARCFLGLDEPSGGAHGEDLDERETQILSLYLEGPVDHAAGAGHVAGIVHRSPGHVAAICPGYPGGYRPSQVAPIIVTSPRAEDRGW